MFCKRYIITWLKDKVSCHHLVTGAVWWRHSVTSNVFLRVFLHFRIFYGYT